MEDSKVMLSWWFGDLGVWVVCIPMGSPNHRAQSTRQHLMPGLGAVPLAEGAKVAEEAKEGRVELQIIQLGTSTDLGEMWIFFQRSPNIYHKNQPNLGSIYHTSARWWFQMIFIFTPMLGEMIQFDKHVFQMHSNDQLVWIFYRGFRCLYIYIFRYIVPGKLEIGDGYTKK